MFHTTSMDQYLILLSPPFYRSFTILFCTCFPTKTPLPQVIQQQRQGIQLKPTDMQLCINIGYAGIYRSPLMGNFHLYSDTFCKSWLLLLYIMNSLHYFRIC